MGPDPSRHDPSAQCNGRDDKDVSRFLVKLHVYVCIGLRKCFYRLETRTIYRSWMPLDDGMKNVNHDEWKKVRLSRSVSLSVFSGFFSHTSLGI